MNEAHLHLIVTHLPVLGAGFGTLLLALGWLRKNRVMQQTALSILLLGGLTAGAAYLTGEGAEEAIEGTLTGIDSYVEQHEEAGLVGLTAAGIAGAMALVVLASGRKGRALSRTLVVLNLVLGLAASGALAWVANLGGQIGHPEIRSGQHASQKGGTEREEAQNSHFPSRR